MLSLLWSGGRASESRCRKAGSRWQPHHLLCLPVARRAGEWALGIYSCGTLIPPGSASRRHTLGAGHQRMGFGDSPSVQHLDCISVPS